MRDRPTASMLCATALLAACLGCGDVADSAKGSAALRPGARRAAEDAAGARDARVNGCTRAGAADARDAAVVTVRFGGALGHNFEPRCVRVARGALLRFAGPLDLHPVAPGRVVRGLPVDEAGPVRPVAEGSTAEFVADDSGAFGFYCDLHVAEGMMGAIFVEERAQP